MELPVLLELELLELVEVLVPVLDPEVVAVDEPDSPLFESFFVVEYRSEPQPPPLRTNELRLTTLVKVPSAPQPSHFWGGGSFNFCNTSVTLPH